MMEDPRKKFIMTISANFLNLEQLNSQIDGDEDLDKFLNLEHVLTLHATLNNANNLQLNHTIHLENEHDKGIVSFYKTGNTSITDENINDVIQVNYFKGKPILGLYHALQNIFTPLILQNKYLIEPTIQEQIIQLQDTLKTSVFNSIEKSENYDSKIGLEVILNIQHELEYWTNVAKNGKRSRDRDMGHTFVEILQPLVNDFSNIDSLQYFDVEDLLENAYSILDDLWRHERYTYPQSRMEHLLTLIANLLIQFIERQFNDVDIWQCCTSTSQNEIFNLLENSISLITRWIDICTRLTKLFWPNHSLHAWLGEAYVPSIARKFQERLNEILHIKTVHRQLIKLLSRAEREEIDSSEFFKPFKNIYALQCNTYIEPQWRTAVLKFEKSLRPAEERVAVKLKSQLGSVHANTRQLLHEFSRYSELIRRPVVKQSLLTEREQLLATLIDYVEQLSVSLQNAGDSNYSASTGGGDTPQIVQDISQLRHLETRAKEVQKVSNQILQDLANFETLNNAVNTLLHNIKQQHSDLFDSWIRQTTKSIENKSLTLKENEPVVEFSKSKLMKVNYPPKLITLIREVRQLLALDYRIPTNIQTVADRAKKFMNYAKILEQVANFHNTIGDRMIPSQRPMMLAGAMELAQLVKEEAAVTWSDEDNVKMYIDKLRTAVDRLSRENNQLAAYHVQLGEKVSELLQTDLIRYQQKWKDGVNFMRDIMKQVGAEGFTNMQAWKQYWDQELAKALEQQYQLGLDQIHHHLPEIKADLVLRSGRVQFNPPVEELRVKYYNQLKRYLSIPYYFRGVSDDGPKTIFSDIVDRNTEKFVRVYDKAEQLIDELNKMAQKWTPWLALGCVDLDELADKHLKTWNDWDVNFRESKSFGQQVAKLTSWEEHVGFFTISLGLARSDMEAHNRRYWSTLVSSLQASITRDVSVIEQFVITAIGNLTKQPRITDDIAEIHSAHAEVMLQFPQMSDLYKDLIQRNKILANWSKERVESVLRLQSPWENLQSLLSNHQQLIEKQLEGVKSNLVGAGKALEEEMERWNIHWEEKKPKPHMQNLNELLKGSKVIKDQRALWDGLIQQKVKLENDCSRFGVTPPDFSRFKEIEDGLINQENEWAIVEDFSTELQKYCDEEWIVIRKQIFRFNDFLNQWEETLLKQTSNPLSTTLLQEIQKFKIAMPTLKLLKGEDFTESHWADVFNRLDMQELRSIDAITLGHFLSKVDQLTDNSVISYLQNMNKKAASEIVVRQALAELESWEVQARFSLIPHFDSHNREIMLIKDFKDIADTIGDNQCLLQSVKSSTDYESFSERGSIWETKLSNLDSFIGFLNQIQHKWIYLEPIFGRGTLRQEQARFQRIDREFRNIVDAISKDPRIVALLRVQDLKSTLNTLLDQLNRCQASLNNFLNEKRSKFPRFLFLSDDDLLEILGQSAHENVIQAHLKKIFAGIHSVIINDIDQYNKKIVAMKSLQGETVPLRNHIDVTKPVEDWLQDLVTEMHFTLKQLLAECLADGRNEHKSTTQNGADPLKYPSQILCLASNINFTKRTEQAIQSNNLNSFLTDLKEQSKYYANLELGHSDNENNESTVILQLKLKALLMDLTHHIAIVEELIENNVNKLQNWHWFKQLRFYEQSNQITLIRMANAEFEYSYEYLGNAAKIVHTPLTDKCFLTLTQGMFIGLGGNPYGPAGTGKTESVKALGGLLGRQVLVFNCDEGIDAKSMERILIGLARCGAWGCFDEFNRLDEGTLSSVSTQIQNIQTAIVHKATTLQIHDKQIDIDPHCGIFVTLNPAGGGYGARNKLPNNLKELFRPIVMSVPDQIHIAQVLLFIDGYQHSKILAKKICELFELASHLLSKQQHYDWGLRALKTVLQTCGNILQQAKKKNSAQHQFSLDDEMALITEAVQLNTLSKLTSEDRLSFKTIIKDVFPIVNHSEAMHADLKQQLIKSFHDLRLQINEQQINKCVELYEQLQQRMGVVIVGPPSSGKSTIRKALHHALMAMKQSVKEHVVNPKAMSRAQLLGKVDSETRQWTDGVLTTYALQAINEPLDVWTWMVCDGDIDPEWIEALNSVLDDNRLLTLPSGWRIQFQPNVNFIFETHDLIHASPATISRMGIISLSEDNIEFKDLIQMWSLQIDEDYRSTILQYVDDYFYRAISWIFQEGVLAIKCSKIRVILTGLSQISKSVQSKTQFTSAIISGLGSLLSVESREGFIKMILEITEEFVNHPTPYLRYDARKDCIENYVTDAATETNEHLKLPLIFTNTVQHALDTLKEWIEPNKNEHFLLIGGHGSAKTLLLEYLVEQHQDIAMVTIFCYPNLKPEYVVHKLSQFCITVSSNRGGRIFRPKKGRLILHFKGLHRLKLDSWGSNILISFLQQLITYDGVFDKNLEWIGVENVIIVGTMEKTEILSTRFTSTVHSYIVELPDMDNMRIIFQVYLTQILGKLTEKSIDMENKVNSLAAMMIEFYQEIQKQFTEIAQRHYTFSPHDITNWCYGLLRYKNAISNSFSEGLMEAVCYEAKKIFSDRLVNVEDKTKFDDTLRKFLQNIWPNDTSIVKRIDNIYFVAETTDLIPNWSPRWGTPLMKYYLNDWKSMVEKTVGQYENENGQSIHLPIFTELLQMVAKINKITTVAGGSVILAGRTGIGRKTATRIAASMRNCRLISVTDNIQQFKIDIKSAMQTCGIDRESVFLLVEDHVLMHPFVQNAINTLIATGEALDLYANTELETIVSVLRDQLEQETFEGSLVEYFHYRVKEQLHIIIILDVTDDSHLTIYEDYPQLVLNCATVWTDNWSETTMQEIPHLLLNNKPIENIDYSIIEIPDGFEKIHNNTPDAIQTPSRFITFIITYLKIYNNKKCNIVRKQDKLQSGVQKLIEARQIVEQLEIEAQEREAELADRQAKANEALEKITLTMKSAHSHKSELQELKEKTENENRIIVQRKKAIELELAEVEPLLQEARGAVGNIRSESLYEIRSLRAPPDVIRDILEGVLRLMGILDTSWNSMKTFLAKRGVKEEIRSFDASFINPENRQAVEKLINMKKDSFDPKNAKRASIAAAPLATWVVANVKYSRVLEKIRPLEKEQQKLQKNLREAEEQIAQLSSGLVDVDATVAKLKSQLSVYSREAAEVQVKLQAAKDTLMNAQGLVSKLDGEFNRWKEQLTDLSEELKVLPVKSLLAAAFITYLSNEDEGQRRKYFENWQESFNTVNSKFSIETFLSTEKEQLQWQSENLPSDKVSIQNGVIILESWLHSLLIDPSATTIEWLKYHFKTRPIEITNQNNPRFTSILELSLRFGKILIIEEIDSLNPILYPILRRNFIQQGARKLVSIAGRLIDYHNDFQLFLASRNSALQLPPAISSFISIVNFTTTLSGLAGQLVTSTIQQERPELENKRHELSQKQEVLQIRLDELQDQLLEDLSNAQGNILENKELLSSLNETKRSSADIAKSLKEYTVLHQELSNEFDVYKPLADFGSNLYFAIVEINRINSLYQFSVSSFKKLFLKILPTLQVEENMDKNKRLLQLVYQHVARGLFNNDRLLFALHLAHKMIPHEIPDDEWELFTRQEAFVGKLNTSNARELVPNWIPENRIQEVFLLQIALPNLYSNLKLDDEFLWKNFMRNPDCENQIPSNVLTSLTYFQQLLIVQALRPDRLYSATTRCASKLIGFKNFNQHAIHLSQLYQEAAATEPILLISCEGIDPSLELRELASKIMPNKFLEIAMSSNERVSAIVELTKAAVEGFWLCLKNLHLVLDWLPILCQKLKELTPNPAFRLWLTTEPHPKFSPVLSQSSLHITYEPPRGIKQNLLRIYDFWTNDSKLINRDKSRQQMENRILFALACIHVIVQERRTFIPQGWSTYYEFSNSDLFAAQRLILHSIERSGLSIEWPVIRGLSTTAIYGGRVDNQQDELVLNSYMEQYFNENILSHLWKPLNLPGVPNGAIQEYLSVIGKLSDTDLPSYFGLPENINRIWEINAGTFIISQLKQLALSNLVTSKFDLSIWQLKLSPILSLWKKLQQKHNWLKLPTVNLRAIEENISPIKDYIVKELKFAQILIRFIHKSLIELSKVLRGSIFPNNYLLTLGSDLINNKTPDKWQEEWEGPVDCLDYIKAIMKRAENILVWHQQFEEINLFDMPIDLAQLFHPHKFLAALKQYTAQERKCTVDNLKLTCDWTEIKTNLSITIENLQLEGAIFMNKSLNKCQSDSPNISKAPNCNIQWIPENQDVSYGQLLYVPLYYSAKRQKRLANLYVPINDSPNTWLQAGVAFFLK